MSKTVKRIEKEFIVRKIIEKETIVRILIKKKEIQAKITKFDDDFLVLHCLDNKIPSLQTGDEVQIFFIFEHNQHTFSTKIKKINELEIIIEQPEKTYKDLHRQYERITSTEDIQVYITIKGKQIHLDFPKTTHYYPIEEPVYAIDFDTSDIHNLIKSFRTKMSDIVSITKIIMLRNCQPSTYEEELMTNTGKILWIPLIEDGFLVKNNYPGYSLLTYKEINEYEIEAGTLRHEIGHKLEILLKDKISKGFFSQLYCPLLYREYLIGYIYLCNYTAKNTKITIDTLKYVYEFSKVLCYSLKTNNYFKTGKINDTTYSTPIIDISGSGLLFAHANKKLTVDFLLHSQIMINLKIGKRKIEINSKIIRKYKDKKSLYVALKFIDITPEDFRFLYEFIYGKQYPTQS